MRKWVEENVYYLFSSEMINGNKLISTPNELCMLVRGNNSNAINSHYFKKLRKTHIEGA